MCYFQLDLKKEPPVIMGLGLFGKIASQIFPKALSVNLSCAAEPFLVPNYPDYLKRTKKYAVPETTIVTNATLLNEKIIASLMNANITRLNVSIDGATKKTYEEIRKGSNFEKVLRNVTLLQEMKKKAGSKTPYLCFDYALMRSTINEFPQFLCLAKALEADSIRASHLIPFKSLDIMDESLVNCPDKANKILDEARNVAKKLKLKIEVPPNFNLKDFNDKGRKKRESSFNKPDCRVPFESMYIASDGRVIPCVWFSIKDWCAGNFRNESFEKIWEGSVYKKLRKGFNHSVYTKYCKNCPVYGSDNIENYVFKERIREDIVNIASFCL